MPDRKIYIRPEAFGVGFDVLVRPVPEEESWDRGFANYRDARGYAGGIKLVRGWKIVDEAGEEE